MSNQVLFASAGVFILLWGIALVFLTFRNKIKGNQKKFLLLAGFSAIGFVAGAILHNLLYALEVLTQDIALVSKIFGFLHGSFFIIAVLVCPLVFLVGIIGSLALLIRKE